MDLLTSLSDSGLEPLVQAIFCELSFLDLKCCGLVSKRWNALIHAHWEHQELKRLGTRFRKAARAFTSSKIQCHRERSVSTVSAIALDEAIVACGLGGSGMLQVWDRRALSELWQVMAHEEGIYTLGMNTEIIASGGDDSKVRIWTRQTGDLLQVLDHHEYIVWNLRLHHGRLISFGYDCKVCTYTRCQEDGSWTLTGVIQGTDDFADALATDDSGRYLTTHVEDTAIWVWDLEKQVTRAIPENDYDKDLFKVSQHILELRGHEIDVLCVKFALNLNLILSGSSDQTIRVWDLSTGVCLKVLRGHSGKVWSLDLDRHRILSGGRHGEIRIWHLEEVFKDNDILDGDTFQDSIKLETIHSSSTAIGQVILDQAMVISADGLGEVVFSDFWTLQEK